MTDPDAPGPNFNLVDERGRPMLFGLHPPDATLPPLAGIYAFMRVSADPGDQDAVRIEGPFHVGVAERFSDSGRIGRRWDEAVASHGATHIATRPIAGERSRIVEARSLVFAYDPPMRNAALAVDKAIRGRADAEPAHLRVAPGSEALLRARLADPIVLPRPRATPPAA